MLVPQRHGGIGAGVGEMARRDRLYRHIVDFPAFAQVLRGKGQVHFRLFGRVQIQRKQPETPLVDCLGADEPGLGHPRRRDAAHPGPTGVHPLGPGTIL